MILTSWLQYFVDDISVLLTVNSSSFCLLAISNCETLVQYFLCSLICLIWLSLEQYISELHLTHFYRVVLSFLRTHHFSFEGLLDWVVQCLSWATYTCFLDLDYDEDKQIFCDLKNHTHTKQCEQLDLGTIQLGKCPGHPWGKPVWITGCSFLYLQSFSLKGC